MKKENVITNLIKEIANNKAKILDDFGKAYLANRYEDYFGKQKKIDFRRLELVEQHGQNEIIYFFRLKKGKLPQ